MISFIDYTYDDTFDDHKNIESSETIDECILFEIFYMNCITWSKLCTYKLGQLNIHNEFCFKSFITVTLVTLHYVKFLAPTCVSHKRCLPPMVLSSARYSQRLASVTSGYNSYYAKYFIVVLRLLSLVRLLSNRNDGIDAIQFQLLNSKNKTYQSTLRAYNFWSLS